MTATEPAILEPTKATLAKYGLTLDEWDAILKRQFYRCGACSKVPSSGRLAIDHEHVKGWKTMDPAIRATFVRGLLCWTCNHYRLARGATVANMRGAAEYLERYERSQGRVA